MKTGLAVLGLALLVAAGACNKADDNTTADTTTVPGVDTTAGKAVPVTDTVVKTTETDTIQGEAKRGDTTKSGTKTKNP